MPATLTSRIKLVKAALVDNADITVNINPSLDIIDTEIGIPKVASGGGLPGTPYDGQPRYDRNDGYTKVWDAIAGVWVPLLAGPGNNLQGAGGSWKQITPTVAGLVLGTGTTKNLFSYIRMPGNIIMWKFDLLLGTAGSLSGNLLVTLPAEFPLDISANISAYSVNDAIGTGDWALTSASATRHSITALVTNVGPPGQIFFSTSAAPGVTVANGANPFVAAAGSIMSCSGWYRTSAV